MGDKMVDIIVRNYRDEDWSRIEEIHDNARKIELSLAGLDDAFVPLAQAAVNEGLFDYVVCVALIDQNVIGFVAYSESEIAWLYVDPDYMGKGAGTSLVDYVIKNTVHKPLEIELLVGNAPALGLYRKMGFEVAETLSGSMPGNESFEVTVYYMRQKI